MSDVLKSDYGKLISLYNMLTSENEVIHKILIPKIQRDYAQGREGMESVRGRFLESIFEVIDKKTPKKLMLDFVFGQKEITTRNIFYPVDGQQRLTTLYLLHLYVGKRAGETTEFLKKFSYETRISSKQFCERLNEIEAEKFSGIGGFIESQWWYTGVWRTDPTISAMINMLKDIDSHYQLLGYGKDDFKIVWVQLKKNVEFWRLYLSDLETTDELYIKMNSRGKLLTDFEHLKAMLDNYAHYNGKLSAKVDTSWTNLLWQYRDNSKDLDPEYYVTNGLDMCFENLLTFYLNVEGAKRGLTDLQSPITDLIELADKVLAYYPTNTEEEEEIRNKDCSRLRKAVEARHIMRRFERILDFFSETDNKGNLVNDPKQFFSRFIQIDYDEWPNAEARPDDVKNTPKVFIGKRSNADLFREICHTALLKNGSFLYGLTLYAEAFFQYAALGSQNFEDRLRRLRNLLENTELHARDAQNTLSVVDELIANGNDSIDSVDDELNKKQKSQEAFKLNWVAAHPTYSNLLKKLENHWLLLGNLNMLIVEDNDGMPIDIDISSVHKFGALFNSSCDYMLVERALLATGDYSPTPALGKVKAYAGDNWRLWKDLTQSFNRMTPQVLQKFFHNHNVLSAVELEDVASKYPSVTGEYTWKDYLRKYQSIYSAPKGKYRYREMHYSYYKLNANGGGGPEYFWNPYNLAVESLLKPLFECSTDCYGGALIFKESGITADIQEHEIIFVYPDGYQFSHKIPFSPITGLDTVDRIVYAGGACKRIVGSYNARNEGIDLNAGN